MLSSKELKQQAKNSLRGRWGQAVLLNLIPTLIAIAIIIIIAVPTALLFVNFYSDPTAVQDMAANNTGGGASSGWRNHLFYHQCIVHEWDLLDILRSLTWN